MLTEHSDGRLTILSYPDFANEQIKHGFSTRGGGMSKPPFSSLNLAYHVGDDPLVVTRNRNLFFDVLGLDLARSTWAEQVHGNRVAVVDEAHLGKGAVDPSTALPATDGMITNLRGASLAIMTADCLAILVFDPVRSAIGVVHAGWRGTLAKLPILTIQAMQQTYGTMPADCQVAIGPGIGPCCFEVGTEVVNAFSRLWGEDKLAIARLCNARWYINLQEANSLILQGIGIPSKNIYVGSSCTSCHPQAFFSYRREQGQTGRMAAVIGLVE